MPRILLLLGFLSLALSVGAAEEKGPAKEKGKKKPLLALDELFRGRVTSLKGDVVEIFYDFNDEKQLDDWVTVKPFRVDGKLELKYENKGARLKGSGCLVHQISFTGKVDLEFDCTPWSEKDFGGIVAEEGQSDQFVLYSVNDLQFQKFDGGTRPGHMICRFGIIDPSEPEGTFPFRYVARGKAPEIQRYKKIRLVCKHDGKADEFVIGDKTLKGREPGRDLLDLIAGVYVAKSGCLVDNMTVRGKISPRWLKQSGAELRLKTPPKPVEVSPADMEAREKIKAFGKGTLDAVDLFLLIDNASVSKKVREEAAEALIGTGNTKLVSQIVSLLYSEDEITRELANDVIKALCGKSFGFSAKDDEEKRSKAIQKILKHIKKFPKKFQ
ncbi:MAG: hypothetical protein ABFS86_08465 [Planctomycetota bacterium]